MDFITIWMGTVTILFIMAMWGWGKAKQEIQSLKREKLENLEYYIEKIHYYKDQVEELRAKYNKLKEYEKMYKEQNVAMAVELVEMVKRVGQNYKED